MDFGDLGDVTFEVEFKGDGCDKLYKTMTNIKCENKYRKSDFKVIINPPAVILFKDGKKYVAKAQDEPFDAERGLMVALLKSFGIGYSDLQKILKNAKYQKNNKMSKSLEALNDVYTKGFDEYQKVMFEADKSLLDIMTRPVSTPFTSVKVDKNDNFESIVEKAIIKEHENIVNGDSRKYVEGLQQITEEQLKVINELLKNKNTKPKRGRPRKIVKDETPKPKRPVGRPRKIKQDEVCTWESEEPKREMSIDDCNKMPKIVKVKRPVGRPRKFRKGDIIAIKEQKTYKYAKINNRANNRLFRDIYEVTAVDDYNNGVFVNGLGWFLPSEVELIEKAK